jgi:uncharacterized protein YdbL (DUF1318 family)
MTWRAPGLAAVLLGVVGCVPVTVNINFPQERIDSAASSIETLVRNPRQPPDEPAKPDTAPPAAPATGPRSDAATLVAAARSGLGVGVAEAEARAPELKTRTPEVMALIASRRARYPELAAAMRRGCLGEANRGLVVARPGEGCGPDVAALVAAENADRMALYRTLVEQNQMPARDLERVQASFSAAHRRRAPDGAWVQDESGRWTRK